MAVLCSVVTAPSLRTWPQENFGRINLWSWIDYDRVVYIDADCLVTGSIEPLLMLPAPMVGAVGACPTHARHSAGPHSRHAFPCRCMIRTLMRVCSTDSTSEWTFDVQDVPDII